MNASLSGLKARLEVGDLVLESALVLPKNQYVIERMETPKTVYNGVPVILEAWCHDVNNENDIGYIKLKTKWRGHLSNSISIFPPPLDPLNRGGCLKGDEETGAIPCIDTICTI